MLRYDRQTKSGLVALYDIQPGNGAGPFLQPQSLHGAIGFVKWSVCMRMCLQKLLISLFHMSPGPQIPHVGATGAENPPARK